jgi:hypothetical protein
VTAAIALVVFRFLLPAVYPEGIFIGLIGGLICSVVIVIWWLFFSRAPWIDRIGAVLVMVASVFVGLRIVDVSISGGMMGMMLPAYSIFTLTPMLVLAVVVTRHLPDAARRALMAVIIFGGVAWLALLRTNGTLGGAADLAWRWTPTAEQRLLAAGEEKLVPLPPAPDAGSKDPASISLDAAPPISSSTPSMSASMSSMVAWPGFRGPNRDSVIRGVRINTDWKASPPVEMWRRPIGPGWSSFAVMGDRFYTQEQRGDDEIVSCYNLATGAPIWRHKDPVRFWESNAGAGPRGTPTIHNGRIYAFGATGLLNALDAATGARFWSQDVKAAAGVETPTWGFSSSPLVVDDVVIVAASGRMVGYDAGTGRRLWVGPPRGFSYSSPHKVTIDGVVHVVMLGGAGATSLAPADGTVLWQHDWEGGSIVQPAITAEGDILINSIGMTGGQGMRRLAVSRGAGGWTVEERWTSNGLKPYFNDFVIHKGHAYGFDGSILASIDLADGKRKWKGGRYGEGQLVLLADQDLLLVLAEEGDLALVNATPDQFKEVARFTAIEGKTWNHPVVVGNLLLVRNGEEMAAFRLK